MHQLEVEEPKLSNRQGSLLLIQCYKRVTSHQYLSQKMIDLQQKPQASIIFKTTLESWKYIEKAHRVVVYNLDHFY